MNLYDFFHRTFARFPDKTAIRFGERELSFRELAVRAGAVARLYSSRGISSSDRIAFYLGNCPGLIFAYLANLQAGLITVPMNTQYRESEIVHMVNDSQPRLIVTDHDGWPLLDSLRGKLAGAEILRVEELEKAVAGAEPRPVTGEAAAAILYTSGTTGRSKGAILTHRNFVSNIETLISAWAWTADDVLLLALPLFHTHGLAVALHGALASGCTTILHKGFQAGEALDALVREGVTLFMGVPTMYVRLLEQAAKRSMTRVELPRMRLFISGSAPLSRETFEEFEQVFGHRILERYGMTETIMNISNPYSSDRIPGTVGLPLPGVSVRIIDDRGTEAPDGEGGELQLQGPNVFSGYWQDPEKTDASFVVDADGSRWFRTGDLGRRDPVTGYYQLLGRRHDLIISGGYNIYPREVEELLLSHPEVVESAVVAADDPALGQVPVAFVVGNATEQQLIDYCSSRIARYKIPRSIRIVHALPRNAMGKVEKRKLKLK